MLEELEDRGVNLCGPFLLSPMAAPFQHHRPTQLRNEGRQIGNQLLHAAEGNHLAYSPAQLAEHHPRLNHDHRNLAQQALCPKKLPHQLRPALLVEIDPTTKRVVWTFDQFDR